MKILEQTLEGLNILVQTKKKKKKKVSFFQGFFLSKKKKNSGQLYLFMYFKHPDLFIHV